MNLRTDFTIGSGSGPHAIPSVAFGPDVAPILESVRTYVEAGYDHLYFHQIGPDQAGFFAFWSDTLQPALAEFREGTRAA